MTDVEIKESEPRNTAGTIKGGLHRPKNIGSFGIVSAENPNATAIPNGRNKKSQAILAQYLQSGHYAFVRLNGRFGKNDESSYFIFNINASALSYYAGKFEYASFVHVRFLDDGQLVSEYWAIQNPDEPYHKKRNTYVKVEEVQGYADTNGRNDDYSVTGKNFKYSLPLGVFESVSGAIENNLQNANENRGYVRPTIEWLTESVGFTGYYDRGAAYKGLYGTINTVKGRLRRPKNIKCFGILSAENPGRAAMSREEDKKNSHDLARDLQSCGYRFVKQKGGKTNDGFSYFILNIDMPTLSVYAGLYEQTSFIYGRFLDDGTLVSESWEKQCPNEPYDARHNPYVKKEEVQGYTDTSVPDDNYFAIGKHFKYNFPFHY